MKPLLLCAFIIPSFSIPVWEPFGPHDGSFRALAVASSSNNIIYIVTDDAGEGAFQAPKGAYVQIDRLVSERFMKEVDYREPRISHPMCAQVRLRGCEHLVFTAYRPDHPLDVLTENMVGCGGASTDDYGWIWFDVGNFKRPWQDEEEVLLIIEMLKQGRGYFAVVDFALDRGVDIQEFGEISLIPIPEPIMEKKVARWHDIDNDNIVGYNNYRGYKRLNDNVIVENIYSTLGELNLKPVARRGYVTVYGSHEPQNTSLRKMSLSRAFTMSSNPSKRLITVSYQGSQSNRVGVVVYDVTGRLIRSLVDDMCDPGHYTVVWDTTDDARHRVPSGICFVRFTTYDSNNTEKLILLR